jgi:hypothetical protein
MSLSQNYKFLIKPQVILGILAICFLLVSLFLILAKTKNLSLLSPASLPPASGRLRCASSTENSILLYYAFEKSRTKEVSLFRLQPLNPPERLITFYNQAVGSGNYTDSNLPSNTAFVYELRDGMDTNSRLLARKTCRTLLPPCSGSLNCLNSTSNSITLRYNFSYCLQGVDLYKDGNLLRTLPTNSGTYTIENLPPNNPFTFELKDRSKPSDNTIASTECSTLPSSASGSLSCSTSTKNSITLNYSFSNSATKAVSLFRELPYGGQKKLTTFAGTSGSGKYTDNGLSPGHYYYNLRDGTSLNAPLITSTRCFTSP